MKFGSRLSIHAEGSSASLIPDVLRNVTYLVARASGHRALKTANIIKKFCCYYMRIII